MQRMKTLEQRKEIISRVDALRKSEGLSLRDAWAKAGSGTWTKYYKWKSEEKAKSVKRLRKRVVQVETPAPAPHIVSIYGMLSNGSLVKLSELGQVA